MDDSVSIQSLKGILPKRKKPVSIAEMNRVIAEQGANSAGTGGSHTPREAKGSKTEPRAAGKRRPAKR